MRAKGGQEGRLSFAAKGLGLICLSLLGAAFLFYAIFSGPVIADDKLDARNLLVIGILSGVIAVAAVATLFFLRATAQTKHLETHAKNEVIRLRQKLQLSESILNSEPQTLIFWEQNGEPRVVVHTLDARLGTPQDPRDILRFRSWLEPDSASDLEAQLNTLFQTGTAFHLMLKTFQGAHLEVDGRAVGGRLILKFRDLAGRKLELAQICDQHRKLSRDITAKRTLLDTVPMPIWFRGENGKIEWVNRAYVAAVESENMEDVIGRQVELLESRQRAAVASSLSRGETYRERLHTIVGGERRSFDATVLPLGGESAGVAIDIAALETAKGELDRHIAAHTRTLDGVSTAVAIFGPDQRLTFFNQAYLDLWELDAKWLESGPKDGEILDRLRALSILPEQADYRAWRGRLLECYQTSEPLEDWWYLPDGRSVHVIGEQSPDGGVTYLYDDATERIALESRYNALFHVQRETLENLREGVAVFASDGRLTLFNRAFASIWKLNMADLEKGPHIDDIISKCRILHDDDHAWSQVKRAVTAIYDRRQAIEGQLDRDDDSVIVYASQPLPDGATLLTYVDITDSKRVERMLIERNEALEAADQLKNDFIQNVSYELRTPLTNIIGFSDLLSSPRIGSLTDKQHEYLGDIRSSSDTLLSIINDILDLATIDAGALELKYVPVDVESVIKAAAIGVRDRLIRAKIGLDIRVEKGLGHFFADDKRVTQVLYNLLSNAIGFSPEGSRIMLFCQRDAGMIVFSVIDQGCGIPEEYQKSVFDRFESRSQGSRHRGAGLGLSLVKSLVELHGGDVILSSKPDKGTTIIVRFPESTLSTGTDESLGGETPRPLAPSQSADTPDFKKAV